MKNSLKKYLVRLMNKGKIGIVTYYKDNYGSFLQAFAFFIYLKNKGYDPVLLDKEDGQVIQKMLHKFSVLWKCLFFPGYATRRKNIHSARKSEQLILSNKSKEKIDFCVEKYLKLQFLTYNKAKKISRFNEFKLFFAGSDQIWNCNQDCDAFKFLNFSPAEKNNALSVSFGNLDIPKYNYKKLIKLTNNFSHISLREESAILFLSKLTGKTYPRTADPSILMNKEEWSTYFKDRDKSLLFKKYIFCHFINKPSKLALECIKEKAGRENCKIVFFGYKYDLDFESSFLDVDPFEFISCLFMSNCVFTDSFHTTLFSINFEKDFYTFEREYLHSFSQSSRLYDLLSRLHLSDRLIKDANDINNVFSIISDKCLENERNQLKSYLNECLTGGIKNEY